MLKVKKILVLLYVILPTYLSHMQGVRGSWLKNSSVFDIYINEWVAFLHLCLRCGCQCANADANSDASRVGLL